MTKIIFPPPKDSFEQHENREESEIFLGWNDVPRREFFLFPKIASISFFFSVLSILSEYKKGKIINKFITSRSFLSSDITPTSSKRKWRIIIYGSVTRYVPQSVAKASG